ncbi:hypothetical protein LPJ64_006197, partial [Coemansia asiatica]
MTKGTDNNAAAFATFASVAKSSSHKTGADNVSKDAASSTTRKEKPCRVCDSF